MPGMIGLTLRYTFLVGATPSLPPLRMDLPVVLIPPQRAQTVFSSHRQSQHHYPHHLQHNFQNYQPGTVLFKGQPCVRDQGLDPWV
jgi:hypothetical protein